MKYLKIKDNVNPEQLLKYGFEKGTMYFWNEPVEYLYYKGEKSNNKRSILLQIQISALEQFKTKHLIIDYKMNSNWISRPIPSVIKKLIEDGLVDEVELNF